MPLPWHVFKVTVQLSFTLRTKLAFKLFIQSLIVIFFRLILVFFTIIFYSHDGFYFIFTLTLISIGVGSTVFHSINFNFSIIFCKEKDPAIMSCKKTFLRLLELIFVYLGRCFYGIEHSAHHAFECTKRIALLMSWSNFIHLMPKRDDCFFIRFFFFFFALVLILFHKELFGLFRIINDYLSFLNLCQFF